MNIRDLEYLLAIRKFGSMARAARHCNVSQSTLSIQLAKLEDQLGTKIFERSRSGFLTTPRGEEILRLAAEITSRVGEIIEIASHGTDPAAGTLKFGAFPTLAPYWFPKIITKLKKHLPKLRLQLYEEKTAGLINKLLSGELDCAALAMPIHQSEFNSLPVFKEEFLLAVPARHPLASLKVNAVDAAQLSQESILLLEEGHCMRGQALAFCAGSDLKENNNYRAASLETLRNMVIAGEGVTLIPQSAVQKNDSRIRYFRFNRNQPEREIGLFWRKTHPKNDFFPEIVNIISQ